MVNKKKKILFIDKRSFGTLIDGLKYCEYLSSDFEITYLCLNSVDNPYRSASINIVTINNNYGKLKTIIKLIQKTNSLLSKEKFDIIFIFYFQFSSLIKLFSYKKNCNYILDLRTGPIYKNVFKRVFFFYLLKTETFFFKNVTIISECLSKKLGLRTKKTHILPLGSDKFVEKKGSNVNSMNLLYVGILNQRHIYKTVYGLKKFFTEYGGEISITYDIVGPGNSKEIQKIKQAVNVTKLENIITLHGKIPHYKLMSFFVKNNIGVSFIPKTEYFECQPPTKTFEYINSGLFCIATSTLENKKLINNDNGILCEDTPESFYEALVSTFKRLDKIKPQTISKTLSDYSWENIINKNLKKYLNSFS
ncbi:glycosyltransferase [Candidatus Sulfidibacterium hydrothermale]|uniref:glycosyltransferase n=1 Tax=Candidatus Sulfidibacterium hydrothermale TaxID=2875962 RepID=UPI001F0B16A5|nr:glycosyltransferase [Candidatus Sulfidibacterium hydrothermale]UBM62458.1 glycosyltransferase [Candidatus Sulfidibacterium hydrothermale]